MPLFYGHSGTPYNETQQNFETASFDHGHSLLTVSSNHLASKHCIKYVALNTIISGGHNCVWQYFVSLFVEMECTFMMCSMFFQAYIRL